jgi:hypothetical protein
MPTLPPKRSPVKQKLLRGPGDSLRKRLQDVVFDQIPPWAMLSLQG